MVESLADALASKPVMDGMRATYSAIAQRVSVGSQQSVMMRTAPPERPGTRLGARRLRRRMALRRNGGREDAPRHRVPQQAPSPGAQSLRQHSLPLGAARRRPPAPARDRLFRGAPVAERGPTEQGPEQGPAELGPEPAWPTTRQTARRGSSRSTAAPVADDPRRLTRPPTHNAAGGACRHPPPNHPNRRPREREEASPRGRTNRPLSRSAGT